MADRIQIAAPTAPAAAVDRISTGSTLLNLALGGGGWKLGRIANLVGDKSTGKTLLGGIEAFANFSREFPDGNMRYGEAEAAFDDEYAASMGLPDGVKRRSLELDKEPLRTVEDYRDELISFMKESAGRPNLYVLDSLDALSDDAELARLGKKDDEGNDKGSYNTEKAKKLSAMYRQLVRDIEQSNTCHIVISQIRERIGVAFGEKYMRAGGKALDFYASQVVWLREKEKLTRTIKGEKRPIGVSIEANVKKLKTGTPYRKCEFDIIFGYGVDDESSMIDWLTRVKVLKIETANDLRIQLQQFRARQDRAGIKQLHSKLQITSDETWAEMEEALAPDMRKYE
jgi:recombination protein RecA